MSFLHMHRGFVCLNSIDTRVDILLSTFWSGLDWDFLKGWKDVLGKGVLLVSSESGEVTVDLYLCCTYNQCC